MAFFSELFTKPILIFDFKINNLFPRDKFFTFFQNGYFSNICCNEICQDWEDEHFTAAEELEYV